MRLVASHIPGTMGLPLDVSQLIVDKEDLLSPSKGVLSARASTARSIDMVIVMPFSDSPIIRSLA
jgi:hypothetical protein